MSDAETMDSIAPARVLVTGGLGFIGRHVVKAYAAAGAHVTVVDSDMESYGRRPDPDMDAEVHFDDVRAGRIANLIHHGGFDVVCHLAAKISVHQGQLKPVVYYDNNVGGMLAVLEGVVKARKKPRVIFASSAGALYPDLQNSLSFHTDNGMVSPKSMYGLTKQMGEEMMAYYALAYGVQCVSLRLSNVYGPGQLTDAVVPRFITAILSGSGVLMTGDGEQTRNFVYVEDVASAFCMAAMRIIPESCQPGFISLNISGDWRTSIRDLHTMIWDKARVSVDGQVGHVTYIDRDSAEVMYSNVSSMHARHWLGWRPVVGLADGLEKTIAWWRNRLGYP